MPLLVVPTPVGNMEDITLRALRELRAADCIACEDTRRTLKLLNRYGIKKTLVSYHRHNERSRSQELLDRLDRGERVALVSDAGTPGISDPGYVLIHAALERGVEVDVLPGANALLPALLLSGLDPRTFLFCGFVEGSAKERSRTLEALRARTETLVFYVSPHGLADTLTEYVAVLGDRPAALVREISKVHQEALRAPLEALAARAADGEIRGELVLVVEGMPGNAPEKEEDEGWLAVAGRLQAAGVRDRDIADALSAGFGIARNRVKSALLELKSGGNERD